MCVSVYFATFLPPHLWAPPPPIHRAEPHPMKITCAPEPGTISYIYVRSTKYLNSFFIFIFIFNSFRQISLAMTGLFLSVSEHLSYVLYTWHVTLRGTGVLYCIVLYITDTYLAMNRILSLRGGGGGPPRGRFPFQTKLRSCQLAIFPFHDFLPSSEKEGGKKNEVIRSNIQTKAC